MTHLSNEVSRHLHAHNHTNIQKRESYILRTVQVFFNINVQRLTFNAKNRPQGPSWLWCELTGSHISLRPMYQAVSVTFGNRLVVCVRL